MEKVKDKYQERVRALAEYMFSAFKAIPSVGIAGADHVAVTKIFTPLARIAVAEMAEAVRSVFSYIDDPGIDPISDVNNYLKEQGLIPDEGLEADTDEKK